MAIAISEPAPDGTPGSMPMSMQMMAGAADTHSAAAPPRTHQNPHSNRSSHPHPHPRSQSHARNAPPGTEIAPAAVAGHSPQTHAPPQPQRSAVTHQGGDTSTVTDMRALPLVSTSTTQAMHAVPQPQSHTTDNTNMHASANRPGSHPSQSQALPGTSPADDAAVPSAQQNVRAMNVHPGNLRKLMHAPHATPSTTTQASPLSGMTATASDQGNMQQSMQQQSALGAVAGSSLRQYLQQQQRAAGTAPPTRHRAGAPGIAADAHMAAPTVAGLNTAGQAGPVQVVAPSAQPPIGIAAPRNPTHFRGAADAVAGKSMYFVILRHVIL